VRFALRPRLILLHEPHPCHAEPLASVTEHSADNDLRVAAPGIVALVAVPFCHWSLWLRKQPRRLCSQGDKEHK